MVITLDRDTGGRRGAPPAETFWVAKCSMKQKEGRSPHDDPDVQLMLRFHNEEEGAFEQLFNKHAASVVNFAFRFLGNRARAEEIAQARRFCPELCGSAAAQQHIKARKVKIGKFEHHTSGLVSYDPSNLFDLFDSGKAKPTEEGPGIAQQEKTRYTLPILASIKRDLSQ